MMGPVSTEGSARSHAEALLRADGERVTGARVAVLDVLDAAGTHLSVAELHRQVTRLRPSTNLTTVYRTVERLTDLGLVHAVRGAGESSYGLAVHGHQHAVCDGCGRVFEIADGALAALASWARTAVGFRVRSVELRGQCQDCQRLTPAR